MSIEAKFNKIKVDSKNIICEGQTNVGCNISTEDKEDIKKILSVNAVASLISHEALMGEVKLNGAVNFKVVYLTNGNNLESLDYITEFTETLKGQSILPQSKLYITFNVIDIGVSSTRQQAKLNGVINIKVEMVECSEENLLEDVGEECLKQTQNVEYQRQASAGCGIFNISEEFETNTSIKKVLLFDNEIVLTDVKCGIDTIIAVGEVISNITYEGENGIVTKSLVMPFSEEVMANGAMAGQKVCAKACIKNDKIILSGTEANNLVKIEIQIEIDAITFMCVECEIIKDVYCAERELELVAKKASLAMFNCTKFYDEKVNGVASLDVKTAGIKNLITTNASRNVIASVIPADGVFTVEGLVTGSVVYEGTDGNVNSVQVELPYSIVLKEENVKSTNNIYGDAVVSNIYARAKRENEVEVICELKFAFDIFSSTTLNFIEAVNVGEVRVAPKNAISVYVAEKGETMWDIAKALNLNPQAILLQNPTLKEPIEQVTPICIFRRLELDQ